jgi:branched-chain amino acid transport system permease protein
MATFEALAQVILSGLQVGSIYALMALSYFVILSSTYILNFAQGEWMMLATVLGVFFLSLGLPYPLAVIVSVLGATSLAILAERLVIHPLGRHHAPLNIIILSLFGIMIVVRYGTGILFGREEYPLPGPLKAGLIRFGSDIFVQKQTFIIYAVTAAVFVGVWLFMKHTWLGRSLRVAAIDPIGATLAGVNLGRVRLAAFGIGGLIAAVTGWLYAPLYAAGYFVGVVPGIKGFIALIIGGMASPAGPLPGGLLLGVLEVAAARYLPSVYSEAAPFLVLMALLFTRPSGLVAAKEGSA